MRGHELSLKYKCAPSGDFLRDLLCMVMVCFSLVRWKNEFLKQGKVLLINYRIQVALRIPNISIYSLFSPQFTLGIYYQNIIMDPFFVSSEC